MYSSTNGSNGATLPNYGDGGNRLVWLAGQARPPGLNRGTIMWRLQGLILTALLCSEVAIAEDIQYGFLQAGQLQLKDSDTTLYAGDVVLDGEYDDLPFFTAGVQKVLGGERIRYGYEGGALISWQNDTVSYSAVVDGGTAINIKIDNELLVFGTLLGAYGDVLLGSRARLYLSGGPMLLVATLKQEKPDTYPQPLSSTVVINGDERETSVGYGAYASAGLIFSVSRNAELGVVVREQAVKMDFNDSIADFPYEGTMYMLSLGYRL